MFVFFYGGLRIEVMMFFFLLVLLHLSVESLLSEKR